jgi:methyltransferase (TIGR00027 family)
MESKIEHVTDTALMVAACRAMETAREDGLVRDPFAERLAGERGFAIAKTIPIVEWMCFGAGIRARTMDELLKTAFESEKIETVVNLGAGLDTRPWRLDLPAGLRWIEADYPDMLQYKATKLAGEKPRCRLEQIPTDLANARDREALFSRIGGAPALMITEGLLMYLPREAFDSIAQEPPRLAGVRTWLLDIASEAVMSMMAVGGHSPVESLRPKDHLSGQAILDAARESGWALKSKRTYMAAAAGAGAERISKLREAITKVKPDFAPPPDELSGMYLLTRSAL